MRYSDFFQHKVVPLVVAVWCAVWCAAQTGGWTPVAGDRAVADSLAVIDSLAAEPVTVSLVTFFPGDESFSIYGHTELRVRQGRDDWYYNYGVFDFEAPGFVWRFVTGDAEYLCFPVQARYARLGMEGRRMVEQRINLTQAEAMAVRDRLMVNALPANRGYHYRYLTNNCSTRPRDIIDDAVAGDSLCLGPTSLPADVTYRDIMRHYGRNYAWQQAGIDLVLGSAIDRPLAVREQLFIPMILMEAVGGATVTRGGHREPLVSETTVVVDAPEASLVLPPTPWWCSPAALAAVLLAAAVTLTVRDVRRRRVARWFDSLLYALLAVLGTVIAFLVLCSQHEALWPNWNLLWAHPLAWVPAVGVWLLPRTARLLTAYHATLGALTAVALLAWPLLPQAGNTAFYLLMAASAVRSAGYIATVVLEKRR